MREALILAGETWRKRDGRFMVDYSNQQESQRDGKHAELLDPVLFKQFLRVSEENLLFVRRGLRNFSAFSISKKIRNSGL